MTAALQHSAPGARTAWAPRLWTALVWALAGASAVYWGLRLAQPSLPPPMRVATTEAAGMEPGALARFLGGRAEAPTAAAPASAALAGRFVLTGVVADRHRSGAALIAVDGKPARPFRLGAVVADDLTVQSLEPRRVQLGVGASGPAALVLELPAPKS